MAVTRCVCREVEFSVVALAARNLHAAGTPLSMAALVDLTTAGTGCGSCRPYLARVALTGEDRLPVMSPHESAAWIDRLRGTASEQPAAVECLPL